MPDTSTSHTQSLVAAAAVLRDAAQSLREARGYRGENGERVFITSADGAARFLEGRAYVYETLANSDLNDAEATRDARERTRICTCLSSALGPLTGADHDCPTHGTDHD